ncbi:MAG TPA: helix-turn-helix domain-containing protein [Brevibacterium sp.]|nr:helix-turn-helix domain-containing protein [Brevibacterium sp.]
MSIERDHLAGVVTALEDEKAAEHALADARERVATGLRAALDAGVTSTQISERTGLTASQIFYRARREPWAAEKEKKRAAARKTAPGLSISAASEQLGISRMTLYTWIDAGRMPTVVEGSRTYVVPGSDGRAPQPSEPGTYTAPPRRRRSGGQRGHG